MNPEKYFTEEQKEAMVAAIREAEKNTSGEIRIHIENKCKEDVLDRAAEVFAELKMNETQLRNGVLLYVALEERKLAIIGDAGINSMVPSDFWKNIKDRLVERFSHHEIVDGICEAVLQAGEELKHWFPCQPDDVNELSDDISFGCKI